jgi:hypothetical protein
MQDEFPDSALLWFHHAGCLVSDIEAARNRYMSIGLFGPASPIFDVTSQRVRVCFIGDVEGPCLELVQTLSVEGALAAMVKKRVTFYHAAYMTSDFREASAQLTNRGLRLVTEFESEAFGGRMCGFFLDEDGVLFELIESPPH